MGRVLPKKKPKEVTNNKDTYNNMNNLIKDVKVLPSLNNVEQEVMQEVVLMALSLKQEDIPLEHFLWSGTYVRTCYIKKGEIIVGAFLKIPTVVIVSGNCKVVVGSKCETIVGYQVLKGSPGRRQAFRALEDTVITMFFATKAKTLLEAEQEMTDEWELLTTNRKEV